MRLNFESLACDLPEDILKAKWAGDFEREKSLLDARLKSQNLPNMLRDRLVLERALVDRFPRRFIYTKPEALERMRSFVPDFTEAEFDSYEDAGCMDYIYVNGEKKYLRSFAGTLLKMNVDLKKREVGASDGGESVTDKAIRDMKANGEVKYRFDVTEELRLDDDAFIKGETYTAHLPVPAASAQQDANDISIEADAYISNENAYQRTACFKRTMNENEPFKVSVSYTAHMKYINPFEDKPRIVYPNALPPTEDDLNEQLPHIIFSPILRSLAAEIAGDETNKLVLAKRIYDYITKNIRYSFMRPYILIDRHAEYACLNRKGDCGIQAILFITLARILGIPARWQSGLTIDGDTTGEHDWAQFYTDEFGWLFADPSYGGGANRVGNESRREFYFGNLDPYRMVANSRYQTDFEPNKLHERFDPYDNQDGEIECASCGFTEYDFDTTNHVTRCERLI